MGRTITLLMAALGLMAAAPLPAAPSAASQPSSDLPVPAPTFVHRSNSFSYDGEGFFGQDALFDDAGADSGPDIYSILTGFEGDAWPVGEQTGVGDVRSVRVRPAGRDAAVVDVTMNSLRVTTRGPLHPLSDPEAASGEVARDLHTVVFLGIDDRPGGFAAWPHAAGLRTPGLDRAYTLSFDGFASVTTGAELQPADVSRDGHTLSVRVGGIATRRPRFVVGGGEWDPGPQVWKPQPGSANPVLDLALSCPLSLRPEITAPASDDSACEWAQSADLGASETSQSFFTVDLDLLGKTIPAPKPKQGFTSYVFTSRVDNGDGYFRYTGNPQLLGPTQAFTVGLPRGWDRRLNQLVVYLHGGGAWGTLQTAVDRWRSKIVDSGRIVLYPYGRGPAGWWMQAAEADVFEAMAASEALFPVDAERRVLTGISMGGFGTYKIAAGNPDLFAGAIVYMGANDNRYGQVQSDPSFGYFDTDATIENAFNLPLLMLAGTEQTLHEMELRRRRLDGMEYEHTYKLFAQPVHGVRFPDEVNAHAVAWLDALPPRVRDPREIVYALDAAGQSEGDDPYLSSDGLVSREGAWWISGVVPPTSRGGAGPIRIQAVTEAISANPRVPSISSGPEPATGGPSPPPVLVSIRRRVLADDAPVQRASIVVARPVRSLTLDLRRMRLREGAVVDVSGVLEVRAVGGSLCGRLVCSLEDGRGRLVVRGAPATVLGARSELPATGVGGSAGAALLAASAVGAAALHRRPKGVRR